MEWIPIGEEVPKDRFRGLRLLLERIFWLLRCYPENKEEEVIEF